MVPPGHLILAVKLPWFTGDAEFASFSRQEKLATTLRALLQPNWGH